MPRSFSKLRVFAWQTVFSLVDSLPGKQARALPQHLHTGSRGEEAALFYLRRNDFTVVAHGWRSGRVAGDLDLIAWEADTLCFVEVKTRSSRSFASAESAIDTSKRQNLRRMARYYLRQLPAETLTRFDVISVYLAPGTPARKADFELFRNAFNWTD